MTQYKDSRGIIYAYPVRILKYNLGGNSSLRGKYSQGKYSQGGTPSETTPKDKSLVLGVKSQKKSSALQDLAVIGGVYGAFALLGHHLTKPSLSEVEENSDDDIGKSLEKHLAVAEEKSTQPNQSIVVNIGQTPNVDKHPIKDDEDGE